MRKVILYIAVSRDGFIADDEGKIDWLGPYHNVDYGYSEFMKSVDAVLMGRTTFEQVLNSDKEYPYKEKANYVFTHDPNMVSEYATFVHEADFVGLLKQQEGKDIWLVGGGELFTSLYEKGLVDELRIFTVPFELGTGKPLFCQSFRRPHEPLDVRSFENEVVEEHLRVNNKLTKETP